MMPIFGMLYSNDDVIYYSDGSLFAELSRSAASVLIALLAVELVNKFFSNTMNQYDAVVKKN